MANLNERAFPKGIREIRYPSNDIIQRFTSKDYVGTLKLNNETGLFEFDPPLEGTGGSSAGTSFAVTQVAHGFSALQPLYHDGTEFKLANSSAEDTLGQWVVIQVTGPDNFTAAQSGRFEVTHGLVPGQFYFVGETDGSITATEPDTYSNPVIFVESTTHIHVLPFRPSTPSAGSGGGGGGAVDSVFGRTGIVTAQSGDYTKDQVGLGNVLNLEQIPVTEKAQAGGVATLDGSGKVPADQIPVALQGGINIVGFWDADTNLPNLNSLSLNQGEAYQVAVAGNHNLNGITEWGVGDLAIWGDTVVGNWFRIENSSTVISVNGFNGAVVLDTDDIDEGTTNEYYTEAKVSANANVAANTAKVSADGSINTHSDVDTQTQAPVIGQPLVWDGINWKPNYIQGVLPSGVQGDVLYHNGSDWVNLNAGTAGQALQTNGAGANPSWENIAVDLGNYNFTGNATTVSSEEIINVIGLPVGTLQLAGSSNIIETDINSDYAKFPNLSIANIDSSGNDSAVTKEWVLANAGGASERENTTTIISADAQTTTIDFNGVEVETLTVNDTITTHTIAVANLSTTERYNTLVIDNSANTVGLTVTFDDQTGTIVYRNARNDFPGTYPDMNVAAGSIWEVNFENRSATKVMVGFDEVEEN